ncbi:TPA: DeoR/GlpR family DNA-binding transcription regulator [Neisseria meningitidis]
MKPKIQRHGEILSLVRRHQFMSVDELAAALDVTPQTIRRDIRELEEGGSLKRHHGGASSGGNLPEGLPADRQTRCQNEKNAIARLIAEHIPDGSSLFVSIGTTMEAVASELVRLGDITAFDKVFTDRLPDTAMQKMLKEAGVECLIADAV